METAEQAAMRVMRPVIDQIIWCDRCGVPRSFHPTLEEWTRACERVSLHAVMSPCGVAEMRYEAQQEARS